MEKWLAILILICFLLTIVFVACEKDDDEDDAEMMTCGSIFPLA